MTRIQLGRSLLYGIGFWFLAAMTVRLFPAPFDGAFANLCFLAASVPVCWLSIPISLRAADAGPKHALDVNVAAIIAATLLDGIGITFASDRLYAGVGAASQFGAAWILWGVGWIMLFAWRTRGRA